MLEQFLKMPLSKKIFALVAIVILIGYLFWQLYHSTLTEELEQAKGHHGRLEVMLAEIEKRKKTYDEDLQRREDLKIASVKQRQMLPVETEMASFLNALNTVADLTGLEILAVKPQEASPEKYYARIPVQLDLKGSYLQLSKFFYQVGKIDRIINVENINLSVPEIDESGAIMQATVLATTFRALDKKKPAAPKPAGAH